MYFAQRPIFKHSSGVGNLPSHVSQNSVFFVGEGATCFFFACGLKVNLLRYYLGINQLLIRGSPKKKFAVKGKGLVRCRHFSDNGGGVQMPMSNFLFKNTKILRCFCMEKRA